MSRTKPYPLSVECLYTDAELLIATAGMDPDVQVGWRNVSPTIMSIARHYGGAVIGGHRYIYFAADDSLWRDDVVRAVVKLRRAAPVQVAQPPNLELF